MCGIFAYLDYEHPKTPRAIVEKLLQGLHALEYRGYDSTGIAVTSEEGKKIEIFKTSGTVSKLEDILSKVKWSEKVSTDLIGIAHTRWATHGQVSDKNAHPHTSSDNNEFVVVHNGNISNYASLKQMLIKNGFSFESETDTEVVAKLAKYIYDQDTSVHFGTLVSEVCKLLEGAFALVFVSSRYPNQLIATKNGSPLLLGIKLKTLERSTSGESVVNNKLLRIPTLGDTLKRAEFFVTSDYKALQGLTNTAIYLEDGDLLHFSEGKYSYMNSKQERITNAKVQTLEGWVHRPDKGNHPHFVLKEIFDQSESIANTLRGRIDFDKFQVNLGGIRDRAEEIRYSRRLIFIASASSYHAAMAVRALFEELTGLPVNLELSSDFLDRSPIVGRNDTCIFISQSGETADVLKALEYCKAARAICVGVTSGVGSPLSRLTDCGIYLNCGAEYGVAATKSYTSQIVALTLLALELGENSTSSEERRKKIITELKNLPEYVAKVLKKSDEIKAIAEKLYKSSSALVMGRGYQNATCLEGALKLKELGYLHSEGILSGELKHGPLALVDDTIPIIFVATRDEHYDKATNAFSQVTARKGHPVILCSEGDNSIPNGYDKIDLPTTVNCLQSIINAIPLQLLGYHVGVLRGLDIDNPKNLAKVVSV